jgi:hypothetical protein
VIVVPVGHDARMALFTDRRSNVVHDIGMNAAPDHDPAAGLHGWASAHADARAGLAAILTPTRPMHPAPNVLPGQMNAPRVPPAPSSPTAFTPNIVSPGEQRQMNPRGVGAPSRRDAWSAGSMPSSQTILPGSPMMRSGQPAQTVLPVSRRPMAGTRSFVGQQLKMGASFAQKVRRR